MTTMTAVPGELLVSLDQDGFVFSSIVVKDDQTFANWDGTDQRVPLGTIGLVVGVVNSYDSRVKAIVNDIVLVLTPETLGWDCAEFWSRVEPR